MRKFLIAAPMALAAAAMLTSPASAAPGNRYNNVQITKEINQLDRKIDRAQQQRSISPREANQLHREVRQIQNLRVQYARGGFTNRELRTLDGKITNVTQQLRTERNDRNDRNHSNRHDYRR